MTRGVWFARRRCHCNSWSLLPSQMRQLTNIATLVHLVVLTCKLFQRREFIPEEGMGTIHHFTWKCRHITGQKGGSSNVPPDGLKEDTTDFKDLLQCLVIVLEKMLDYYCIHFGICRSHSSSKLCESHRPSTLALTGRSFR